MAESTKIINSQLLFFIIFSIVTLVLVIAVMLYFVIRYGRKRNPVASDISGHVGLELLWIIVPTLIVLGMFWIGLTGYLFERKVPAGAMTVKVLAFQYGWTFTYENGTETPELRVPAGVPVKLLLTSKDVIHSFYVPEFRIKQDAVPGITTTTWFQDNLPGEFDVLCAEYCGVAHSGMLSKVIVMPRVQWIEWYENTGKTAATARQ